MKASPIEIVKAKLIAKAYTTIKINLIHLLDFKISSLLIVFIIYILNSTSTSIGLLIKSLINDFGDAF
jgi:hypothetical protein